jgi:hypothetical protein
VSEGCAGDGMGEPSTCQIHMAAWYRAESRCEGASPRREMSSEAIPWARRSGKVEYRVRVKFVARDLWIGAYWTKLDYLLGPKGQGHRRTLYVCLLPMLPLVIERTDWR